MHLDVYIKYKNPPPSVTDLYNQYGHLYIMFFQYQMLGHVLFLYFEVDNVISISAKVVPCIIVAWSLLVDSSDGNTVI